MKHKGRRGRGASITTKELAFVEKYVETLKPTESAIHAGYKSPRTTAYALLRRPGVQAAIEIRRHQIAGDLNITPSEVIRRMMLIGYADPAGILDQEGKLLPMQSMPKEIRLALAEVRIMKTDVEVEVLEVDKDKEPVRLGITTTHKLVSCKFWDKPKMLNSLAEHLNLFSGGRQKHPFEDMTIEELERLSAANEAAIEAIEGAAASSRKSLLKAVAKSSAAAMAEDPKPNGAKKPNGKGNGKSH